MNAKRTHIFLPEDLLQEIDALVGPRGRSSFLVETARNEVRRQKLLQFLESPGKQESKWHDKRHPELTRGAAAWVRELRGESDARGSRPPKARRSRRK